jgi:2-polyprenyl-3-methyl-5-hydroxy-6-metoxy-1,4-benzoquinol methylase
MNPKPYVALQKEDFMTAQTTPAAASVQSTSAGAKKQDVWPPSELETVDRCPVCGADNRQALHHNLTDTVFFCSPGSWSLYRCQKCGDAYLNPRPTLASIAKAYQTYYTHAAIGEEPLPKGRLGRFRRALKNGYLNARYGYNLAPALTWGRWIMVLFLPLRCSVDRAFRHLPLKKPGARLLDIGCGNGAFVREACTWGWNAEGMDPDPNAAAAGQKAGVRITTGALPQTDFPGASFDAITMSHSIEHLHDPVACLKEAHRILRPGGSIWIATPNLNSMGHHLFGKNWRGLEPPRHLVLFTAESLAEGLRLAGFEQIQMVRSNFNARWYFTSSYRLEKGEDPMDDADGSLLPALLDLKARVADWHAFLRPQNGEEIVFTATRPS